jgi:hypothetical protein
MIPASTNQLFSAGTGYQISRSVRLRSSASAYFNRTPASAGNRKTWTWSGWTKRGAIGAQRNLFTGYVGSGTVDTSYFTAAFNGSDKLVLTGYTTIYRASTPVYRDPSAWYHIVVAVDTTQATAANRFRVYINGLEVTAFDTSNNPAQNTDLGVNQASPHYLGWDAFSAYLDGYLTEVNFIDGYPTGVTQGTWAAFWGTTCPLFGVTNAYGVWSPTKYNGTYGTNGFYLNFSDNSAATAAAIGKDNSGNGNNFTPNNISVTAGVTYDSMLDVPTPWGDGGNGRGNYCTLNRLVTSGLSGGGTISNGNLRVSGAAAVSNAYARGTMTLSGKFYAEFSFDVVNATASIGVDVVTATAGALNTSSTNVSYRSGGNRRVLGTETAYGASWVANDIIGVAVDTAANTVEFFKNGTSQGVITSSAFFAQGDCVFAMSKDDVGSPNGFANFGQRPFAYTPPTGFNALNTFNLPTPTIANGALYMAATTYTGNGTSLSVNNTVNNASFQPDFVWVKNRGAATSHVLQDAVRGAGKTLFSNSTAAESGNAGDLIASFNSNGFTVNDTYLGGSGGGGTNGTSNTYIGWQWKEGATQGFDIVTYTGNGANRTIAHNLGVAPSMIIVKQRSGVNDWPVYHANQNATPQNGLLYLNATNAYAVAANVWNSTAPTSSVFSVGTNGAVNGNTATYVAYLFAQVAGFSRAFSYTGNGSADGTFVHLGFRPRFVMFKRSDAASAWTMYDTARDLFNPEQNYIQAQSSAAEAAAVTFDILANGFKLRTTGDPNVNGGTYVGMAFAEVPFKFSLGR